MALSNMLSRTSIMKGCHNTTGNMTGLAVVRTGATYYTTTLPSGSIGSLVSTYIPLFALSGNLTIRITTNTAGKALQWPAADSDLLEE